MAYKSKKQYLERDGKTLSYCHVDPKLGKACSVHIHPSDLDLAKLDAQRLRQLGEELITMSEAADEAKNSYMRPEKMFKTLGIKKPAPTSPEEANSWIEANSTPVATSEEKTILTDGTERWSQPNPKFGPPKCNECGNLLEQRILNTGQRVWHHIGHAELDNYFDIDSDVYNYGAQVSNNVDDLDANDIEIIKANVAIGNTYLDSSEWGYGPITLNRQWNTPTYETSHDTYPAQCCTKCGSQDLAPKYRKTGFFKIVKEAKPVPTCGNCGNEDDRYNRI